MRLRFIWAGLLALLLGLWSAPASALSCVEPAAAFEINDVVVRATVTDRPDKHRVVLSVDRYYKGRGPAVLRAEVQGIKPDNDLWMDEPVVGSTYFMGFVQQAGKLLHRPCDIFLDPAAAIAWPEFIQKMGQGVAPTAGTAPPEPPAEPARASFPWRTLAVGAGLALSLAALGLVILRRRLH